MIGGFASTIFAAETAPTPAQAEMGDLAKILNVFVAFLSRIRIFFANIAGKLLMNSRVYGEGIGMDRYLRILRNAVRNISNYIL